MGRRRRRRTATGSSDWPTVKVRARGQHCFYMAVFSAAQLFWADCEHDVKRLSERNFFARAEKTWNKLAWVYVSLCLCGRIVSCFSLINVVVPEEADDKNQAKNAHIAQILHCKNIIAKLKTLTEAGLLPGSYMLRAVPQTLLIRKDPVTLVTLSENLTQIWQWRGPPVVSADDYVASRVTF